MSTVGTYCLTCAHQGRAPAERTRSELGVSLSLYQEATVSKDAVTKAMGKAPHPLYSHYSLVMQESEAC